ncbi:phytanoyl-CoA dioxygenase family protein [Pseudoduganella violaceinigra]|uniref:phytanoyl-CoA dioxygenase family protein n=1 Tax=Pseudoduganella violaceinigra TaxID=246602 RepID=UPI0005596BF2|nr:phytanoyl-CoA dioxygenase family protein [Pseudoduganella violaceinigra]
MKPPASLPPEAHYGVLLRDQPACELDEIADQIRRLGYAVVDSGYSAAELNRLSAAFNQTRQQYVQAWGADRLRNINELHTIRAPLTQADPAFLELAGNPRILDVLGRLIVGKFILNQQNGIINPPGETYNQAAWHRDLPYQHFVSSSPLALNALFCLDDFTRENGSTFVLPATHKSINYPSAAYIEKHAVQLEAKAGQYLLLDCMMFHSGGFNRTHKERRAVNHVYTIPYFKQQIKLAGLMHHHELTPAQRELFGFGYQEPVTIEQYLENRKAP